MVKLKAPAIMGKSGVVNKVIKFAINGILGSLIVVVGVALLGELFGGLVAGAALAAMGEPVLGSVIAFDGVLSLFRPQPSGGL